MKSFCHVFFALILMIFVMILLCACSTSGRTGFGPYDFTDYSDLDAQQDMWEARMEMTMYPEDDWWDIEYDRSATEVAEEMLSEYLYEQYLLEQQSGE